MQRWPACEQQGASCMAPDPSSICSSRQSRHLMLTCITDALSFVKMPCNVELGSMHESMPC